MIYYLIKNSPNPLKFRVKLSKKRYVFFKNLKNLGSRFFRFLFLRKPRFFGLFSLNCRHAGRTTCLACAKQTRANSPEFDIAKKSNTTNNGRTTSYVTIFI
nr:MAG TPA: hypothetical protein [Bacteriophage sp.]